MVNFLSIIALGFFLGMRHATDPDHVIAVSTIVTRYRTLAAGLVIGAVWGLGHSLTIVAAGGAIIIFRLVIPPALGLTVEMTVAVMLVGLGAWNIAGVVAQRRRHGPGEHGADGHREDQRPQAWLDRHLGGVGLYPVVRPLVVGLVHGLAGSATVALLVLTIIGDPRWAVAYLVLFGLGTIVGMTLITLVIAAPLTFAVARMRSVQPHLRMASGVLSVAFG